MKRILLLAFGLSIAFLSSAQLIDIEIVEHIVHDDTEYVDAQINGGAATSLDGYITYKLYANCTNEDDYVTAVLGDENGELMISLTNENEDFWNHPGGVISGPLNDAFFDFLPMLPFDTHLTLGWNVSSEDPGGTFCDMTRVEDSGAPTFEDFGNGGDLIANSFIGASYFILPGSCDNGYAGADLRVELGQFTVNAAETDINIVLCAQVFTNGEPSENFEDDVFCGLSASTSGEILGCTDDTAINYNENATQDDGSCVYPCALEITENDLTVTDAICFGGNDGSVVVTGTTGGQGTVLFSLDDDDYSANPTINGLTAGDYTMYVIDNEGCTSSVDFAVGSGVEILVSLADISVPSCNGFQDGEICVAVAGGVGSYFLALSEEGLADQNTELCFNGIGAGTYTVYAEDENGCIGSSEQIILNQPNEINLDVNDLSDASCGDVADGCAIALASGGTPPFVYSIEDWIDPTTDNELCGLVPGEYFVDVIDDEGCTTTGGPLTIQGPETVGVNSNSVTDVSCFNSEDGEICVSGFGGNGNYLYSINDCAEFTNSDGCFADLAPGEYTLCAESAGCTGSSTFTVDAPSEITFELVVTEVSEADLCDGETEITNEGGGTGDLTIVWTIDGGDQVVGNTNPNLCSAQSGTVTLTDENGCEVTESWNIIDGIYELENSVVINMYPNPTNGIVNISIEGLSGQDVAVKIINSIGAQVDTIDFGALSGIWNEEIRLDAEANGIYFINLTIGEENISHRVVKN